MAKAYKIAAQSSKPKNIRNKDYYDQKPSCIILRPEDCVLIRNLSQRGGPGKLRSFWEPTIYVVKEQLGENFVYKVHRERDEHKVRTLNRNHVLLVNDLPTAEILDPRKQRVSKGRNVNSGKQPKRKVTPRDERGEDEQSKRKHTVGGG